MAVTQTGAIFNSLVFGGIDSADYGIYITGEAVYNAPTRAVEMVSVPGRNGAILVDQGYYENIEVSYPCGTFASTQAEFATNLASFRNAILSQKGYNRLTDTYNPNEYRMATYIAGLEVSPTNIGIAGEFELRFNAKPQRFLTSGESEISVANNGTISNPTLYDASPLVEVEGYGTINVNGHEIELGNVTLGLVTVGTADTVSRATIQQYLSSDMYNNGDTLTIKSSTPKMRFTVSSDYTIEGADNITNGEFILVSAHEYIAQAILPDFTVTAGTDASETIIFSYRLRYIYNGSGNTSMKTVTIKRQYTASDESVTYTITNYTTPSGITGQYPYIMSGEVVADSSLPNLGHPTYIDCDLGVCYKIEGSTVIDLNAYIDLGSDLPTLSSGSNTITFDNTITDFKIIPRWWQL